MFYLSNPITNKWRNIHTIGVKIKTRIPCVDPMWSSTHNKIVGTRQRLAPTALNDSGNSFFNCFMLIDLLWYTSCIRLDRVPFKNNLICLFHFGLFKSVHFLKNPIIKCLVFFNGSPLIKFLNNLYCSLIGLFVIALIYMHVCTNFDAEHYSSMELWVQIITQIFGASTIKMIW